jgi:hypothetical protein
VFSAAQPTASAAQASSQADAQAVAALSSAAIAEEESPLDMELFELPSDLVVEECESPPLSPVPAPISNPVETLALGPSSPKAKSPMRQTSFLASPARKQLQTLSDAERAATMALSSF